MANRVVYEDALFPSAIRTVTENGDDFGSPYREVVFSLDITASAGTSETLDITIEEKDPISGIYTVIDTFPQQTGVAFVRRTLTSVIGSVLRARAVIGGTGGPSFTFSLGANGKAL